VASSGVVEGYRQLADLRQLPVLRRRGEMRSISRSNYLQVLGRHAVVKVGDLHLRAIWCVLANDRCVERGGGSGTVLLSANLVGFVVATLAGVAGWAGATGTTGTTGTARGASARTA